MASDSLEKSLVEIPQVYSIDAFMNKNNLKKGKDYSVRFYDSKVELSLLAKLNSDQIFNLNFFAIDYATVFGYSITENTTNKISFTKR
jgi:hypothetical protein